MAFCRYCGAEVEDGAQSCPKCGKSLAEEQAPVQGEAGKSEFTGGAFMNWIIGIATGMVSVCTLGLLYPFMVCVKLRWECEHTYINGKQLNFDGTAMQLFGNYIKWLLLSVVTLGIYAIFFLPLNMTKWKTKHTHFLGCDGESVFDGNCLQLFGVNLFTGFVTLITLSFGMYWAHCYKERWFAKHTNYDGAQLAFDGKAIEYFGSCIKWVLLTIITFGIYSIWLTVKIKKWTTKHTLLAA